MPERPGALGGGAAPDRRAERASGRPPGSQGSRVALPPASIWVSASDAANPATTCTLRARERSITIEHWEGAARSFRNGRNCNNGLIG
jgi:hypothetical protein